VAAVVLLVVVVVDTVVVVVVQGPRLHVLDSLLGPVHLLPPPVATLRKVRKRDWTPVPHVAEQALQAPKLDHSQFPNEITHLQW